MQDFPSYADAPQAALRAAGPLARIRGLLASQERREALVVTSARVLQNVLGFVISLAILKKFGLDALGSFTVASLGVAVLATFLTFGLPFTLAKAEMPVPERNSVGALAGAAAAALSAPFGLAIGFAFGHDSGEAMVIAVFTFGGAFFANNSIIDALLVLQGRTRRVLVVSCSYLAGVAAAATASRSLLEFALLLAIGRSVGQVVVYARLPYRWCGWEAALRQFRIGARYLVPDTLGLLGEQLSVAALAALTTRSEIGLFGLCRQFLTAAETPLWSRLLVAYPRVCEQPHQSLRMLREMVKHGAVVMAALIFVTAGLAKWLYESPEMLQLAPLLMLAIPFRYAAGAAEICLRAIGAVRLVNRIALIRLALLCLTPIGLYFGRLTGVVWTVILQAAIMAWLGSRAVRRSQAVPRA